MKDIIAFLFFCLFALLVLAAIAHAAWPQEPPLLVDASYKGSPVVCQALPPFPQKQPFRWEIKA